MSTQPLRCLITPCRSASTAILQAFAQNPEVQCLYQPIKTGQRKTGSPDYSVYEGHPIAREHPRDAIIFKETIGHSKEADCQLNPFRSDFDIVRTRPLFLFRNPLKTWNSWKSLGWENFDLFKKAYKHTFNLMQQAKSAASKTKAATTEFFLKHTKPNLQTVCANWGIPFSDKMVGDFQHDFFEEPRIHMEPESVESSLQVKAHDKLNAVGQLSAAAIKPKQINVSLDEASAITTELMPLYEEVQAIEAVDFPTPSTTEVPLTQQPAAS